MTKLIFIILIVFVINVSKNTGKIIINVSNINNNKGQILVLLYNSEDKFLNEAYLKKTSEIKNNKSQIIINNIPNGTYAFAIIHDENKNGKLDFNFLGIPSEDVAASNNASGFMGPPSYNDSKFIVTSDIVTQNIKM